jgi:hypothetical protein
MILIPAELLPYLRELYPFKTWTFLFHDFIPYVPNKRVQEFNEVTLE